MARWTHVAVGSLYVLGSIGNTVGETWSYYWFGAAVEAVLLLLVVWQAWTWPQRRDEVAGQTPSEEAMASTR